MMGFLTKLIPGGWVLYLVIGLAVFGAGSAAGYKAKALLDAPTIARLQEDVANGKTDTQKALNALVEQQKQTALDLAAANAAALAQKQALDAQSAALATQLARAETARQQASTKLLDALKATPDAQKATLSPSVRAYLAGVRDAQAAGAPTAPAPDRNQDGLPISGCAAGGPLLPP